jgi:hypothetical protein
MKKIIEELRSREIHEGSFSAEKIDNYPNHYIALDSEKKIVLLLRSENSTQNTLLNSRGKYLNIFYNEVCEVRTLNGIEEERFTILNLMSNDLFLEELFLKIVQDLLEILGNYPSLDAIQNSIQSVKDIFSNLLRKLSKEELGLWGELFIINTSNNPKFLIDCWHLRPNDTFDFNAEDFKLEIKTTLKSERIHSFSLAQVNKNIELNVIVCSIMTSQIELGISVQDLISEIRNKIPLEYRIKFDEKLTFNYGASLFDFNSKFDSHYANISLLFFESCRIPKINSEGIDIGVSNIKFYSTLEKIDVFDFNTIKKNLFNFIN